MMTFLYSNKNQDSNYFLQCYEINIRKKYNEKLTHLSHFSIKISYAVPATNRNDISPSH